jgi:hypothetical protein
VAGYAAEFVRSEVDTAAVFPPGDVSAGVRAFESLTLLDRPRPRFVARYARDRIMEQMADDVVSLLHRSGCATEGAQPPSRHL